jgi:adenylosuccinate synthase
MKRNENIAVLGCQIGDEAKARCANYFARDFDYIVRFGSSGNAGHTIYHEGKKIVRHLLPSADFSTPRNKSFLGAGMVIHLEDLLKEVKETEEMFAGSAARIIVDPDAFVVFDNHIEEDKAKNGHIGSTNKGVTPAYKDKIGRTGTKIRSLMRDGAEIIKALQDMGVQFKHVLELKEQMELGRILFEGSQSIQLDFNFGNYPFVTSGECGLGGIYNAGFAFAAPTKVYGIAKPYVTKAGGGIGKFTTEMSEQEASVLRERGGEIGATTGRPRRIGYMDLPALKYSAIKGGITHLIFTKLDILNGMEKIKVCYDYGKSVVCGNDFEDATPYYVELPGWKDAKDVEQIQPFIKHVQDYMGIPVAYVSTGVNEDDMIDLIKYRKQKALVELQEDAKRFCDPFDTPPEEESKGFVKYGEESQQTNNLFDTSKLDETFKKVGYPTLAEVMSEIIKENIVKKV